MLDLSSWDQIQRSGLYGRVFPTGRRARALHRREICSAVGREGLWALVIYVGASLVLLAGIWVCGDTWATTGRGFATIPLVDLLWFVDASPAMNLRFFWILFLAALALVGWLLSSKVTKRTLRAYVAVGLLILLVLLITIGRNGKFERAEADARSDAARLLEAEAFEATSPASAGSTLLVWLCESGGIADGCTNSSGGQPQELSEAEQAATQLRCLPGWTVSAVDQWRQAASFDREVVALRALASCENRQIDPGSESAEGEAIDVAAVETDGGDGAEGSPEDVALIEEPAGGADAEDGAPPATIAGSTAVTEAFSVQRSEVQAFEAISLGADEILSFASGSGQFAEFRFSGAAWLVLLGLVLVWYRHLEVRAGARRLGPVTVQFEPIGATTGATSGEGGVRSIPADEVEAIFKESVIRNVPEPGAAPGSGALAPVGDLVAESDLPQRKFIGAAIDILQKIFATKGGFTVTCSVRHGDGDAWHSVFVRLRDTRTGQHRASYVAESPDREEAARLAGYWIAGWIISRSAYVPSWATWSEHDAASFVNLGWVQGDETSLIRTQRRPAVRRSGGNGASPDDDDLHTVNSMILAQRAYTHQLEGRNRNHFAALEDFARAVHRQPRYPVARYRRGVVLGTMMLLGRSVREAQGRGAQALLPTPRRLEYLFGDLILGHGVDDARVRRWCESLAGGAPFSPQLRQAMLLRVADWANENRAALRWRWLARLLRPSERFFWSSFSRGRLETDWALVADLERHICAERLRALGAVARLPRTDLDDERLARGCDDERRKIEDRAREPDSHWQLSYNLGCFYAIRLRRVAGRDPAEAERCRRAALGWLERSLDRPWSGQLVREWIDADGDLKPLHDTAEFDRWAARVPPIERPTDVEDQLVLAW